MLVNVINFPIKMSVSATEHFLARYRVSGFNIYSNSNGVMDRRHYSMSQSSKYLVGDTRFNTSEVRTQPPNKNYYYQLTDHR